VVVTRRAPLTDLPFWPRYLSRDEAARYVGVSAEMFDEEVAGGHWPGPRRRGRAGGRLTWDRLLLDAAADRDSGIGDPSPAGGPPLPSPWVGRSNGTPKEVRSQRRQEKAA
jgi:hypothetical protein